MEPVGDVWKIGMEECWKAERAPAEQSGGLGLSTPCPGGEEGLGVRFRLPDLAGNGNGTFRIHHGIDSWQSTNPATTGCPLAASDCRQKHDHASPRGEWRSHSSGRRVVAASVLVSRRLAHDAGSRMKKCQVTFRKTPSKPARGQEV